MVNGSTCLLVQLLACTNAHPLTKIWCTIHPLDIVHLGWVFYADVIHVHDPKHRLMRWPHARMSTVGTILRLPHNMRPIALSRREGSGFSLRKLGRISLNREVTQKVIWQQPQDVLQTCQRWLSHHETHPDFIQIQWSLLCPISSILLSFFSAFGAAARSG